jgi:hypothetical protein
MDKPENRKGYFHQSPSKVIDDIYSKFPIPSIDGDFISSYS